MKYRYTFPALLLVMLLILTLSISSLPRVATAQGGAEPVEISDNARAQIAALMQEKESRTPAQQKIDSKVLQAIRENRGEPMAPGVDSLRPAEIGQIDGWVILDLRATIDDNLLDALTRHGAEIINAFPRFEAARIRIALDRIESIAELPQIKFISREMTYDLNRMDAKDKRAPMATEANPSTARQGFARRAANVRRMLSKYLAKPQDDGGLDVGTVLSQGDRVHRADEARAVYGHQGEGIKIGVISDSYNFLGVANSDILSGNLPGPNNPNGNTTPVTVIQESGNTDEGRAMLQLVHDIVPRAQLYFATANGGPANFANNILLLQAAGCRVIIDDVSYFNESPFQSGPVGIAVESVTSAGVLYFASAGNAGSVLKGTAGVWEGDYNDNGGTSTLTIPGNAKTGTVHDFDPGAGVVQANVVTVGSTRPYSLYWSDPLGASSNDYDFFIMNATLTTVFDSSTTTQSGTQDPYEQSAGTVFAGDRVVVFKQTAAAQRAIHINTNRGTFQTFRTTGQTHSHSATVSAAFNMAAAPAVGPFPNPFSSASLAEPFSSDGPRRVFYNSNGTAITPGNLLFSTNGGVVLSKPDLTAADGVSTTFPAASGLNPFFGTSAASPHAGAIAALILSANPGLTAAQVRTILENNAVDIETPGTDITTGRGIIQAFQSVGAAMGTPSAGLNLGTVTVTESSPSNGNGIVEPGDTINVVVQLTNPSSTTATGVTATLGPAAPDQGTGGLGDTVSAFGPVSYGNIAPSASVSNTGTPFRLTLGRFPACNALVPVAMVVNLGGGASPISFNFNIQLGNPMNVGGLNVITTLDGVAPPAGPGFTTATGTQTGRLNRNGVTSSCSAQKATPPLQDAIAGRKYDSYTLTNPSATNSVCYTITVSPTCTPNTMFSVAYGSGGFVPTAIQTNYRADTGVANALPPYSVVIPPGQSFTVVVHEITAGSAACGYTIDVSGVTVPVCAAPFVPRISEFGTDNKSDIGVFRPSEGNWYLRNSTTGVVSTVLWGDSSDKPVPGDYDGDGQTDVAVYRSSEGNWYIINSSGVTGFSVINWGSSGDIPVPGDYDGDRKTDAAVFRPSENKWYIKKSGGGTTSKVWGTSTDKLVPADYDGDGRTDLAIWRPSDGNWYIINSATNSITIKGWGASGDILVPADYDGDRRVDIAVWRPSEGNWYIINSATNTVTVKGWGAGSLGDIPVPADYDGDGRTDIAVLRPSEGNWYILNSSDNSLSILNLGGSGDVPIPAAYIPQ